MKAKQFYSIPQVAEMLGVYRTTLYYHIAEGHLRAEKAGDYYFVHRRDLEKFKRKAAEYLRPKVIADTTDNQEV